MNAPLIEMVLLAAFCATTFLAFRIEHRELHMKGKQPRGLAAATMREILLGAGQIILMQILIALKLAGH